MQLVISCEHATNKIPGEYLELFKSRQRILDSHRGWDIGAEKLSSRLSRQLHTVLFKGQASRLLIDLNRSLHHPNVFSEFSKKLKPENKKKIISRYYLPYRESIENHIHQNNRKRSITAHFSIHSFTPELGGIVRNCDVGLLYDPARMQEKSLAILLAKEIKQQIPDIKVRRNYPYRGNADGLTTWLRTKFADNSYLGMEIEVNQKHVINNDRIWQELQKKLGIALKNTLFQLIS